MSRSAMNRYALFAARRSSCRLLAIDPPESRRLQKTHSDLVMLEPSWLSVSRTHPGNRRQVNEDAVMACSDESIWAVADGMGGHSAGDVASRSIAEALVPKILELKANHTLVDRVDWIEDRLLSVHQALHKRAKKMGPSTVIGSTVVSLTIEGSTGVVLWAGDSRLYRLRRGCLEVVTRDHNPITDLLDSGAITEAEALAADTNLITRSVGGQRPLELDIAVFDLESTDTLLLCTDGLYREVVDSEIAQILAQPDLDVAASELVELALSRPARDNISLLALRGFERVFH